MGQCFESEIEMMFFWFVWLEFKSYSCRVACLFDVPIHSHHIEKCGLYSLYFLKQFLSHPVQFVWSMYVCTIWLPILWRTMFGNWHIWIVIRMDHCNVCNWEYKACLCRLEWSKNEGSLVSLESTLTTSTLEITLQLGQTLCISIHDGISIQMCNIMKAPLISQITLISATCRYLTGDDFLMDEMYQDMYKHSHKESDWHGYLNN